VPSLISYMHLLMATFLYHAMSRIPATTMLLKLQVTHKFTIQTWILKALVNGDGSERVPQRKIEEKSF